jgi:hypothetical protein
MVGHKPAAELLKKLLKRQRNAGVGLGVETQSVPLCSFERFHQSLYLLRLQFLPTVSLCHVSEAVHQGIEVRAVVGSCRVDVTQKGKCRSSERNARIGATQLCDGGGRERGRV